MWLLLRISATARDTILVRSMYCVPAPGCGVRAKVRLGIAVLVWLGPGVCTMGVALGVGGTSGSTRGMLGRLTGTLFVVAASGCAGDGAPVLGIAGDACENCCTGAALVGLGALTCECVEPIARCGVCCCNAVVASCALLVGTTMGNCACVCGRVCPCELPGCVGPAPGCCIGVVRCWHDVLESDTDATY